MGRKPNPVITQHFTRGEKHGQTTNRYAQTCKHCNLRFPTGRPETLFAHIASCPALSQGERAEAVQQIYYTPPLDDAATRGLLLNQPNDPVSSIHHLDDFDITGLRVLAGAAENAEDLALDPQITGHESAISPTVTDGQNLPFYDNHYAHSYQPTAPHNSWPYQFSTIHNPTSPFHDVSTAVSVESTYTTATLPPLTQWSFAPILTTPIAYVSHPSHQAPVSFADQHDHDYSSDQSPLNPLMRIDSSNAKTRKTREPYSEPKRARVAEMRQIGACIRCSRLRKTCEPARPCKACTQTVSKTWLGGCTTLNKGQEFTNWYDNNFEQAAQATLLTKVDQDAIHSNVGDYLEVSYFHDVPKLRFNLTRVYIKSCGEVIEIENRQRDLKCYVIQKEENIAVKLLNYVRQNQEEIIESINIPAIYATVRAAHGLAAETNDEDGNLIWGSSKRSDPRLAYILNLWLIISLLVTDEHKILKAIVGPDGQKIDDALLESSFPTINHQMMTAIETTAQQGKEQFRKFDGNILNQSYKHIFNLVVGMFLILDAIEQYCCLIKRHGLIHDEDSMFKEGRSLAYKYAYCVQNIQMIPMPFFDAQSKIPVSAKHDGRIDYEMQRGWLADLCLSQDELERCLYESESNEWTLPSGRLWSRLFLRIKA